MSELADAVTARALGALPEFEPPAGAWMVAVRRAGSRQPEGPRFRPGYAVAAVAASAVLAVGVLLRLAPTPDTPIRPVAIQEPIAELRAQSDWLEARLAELPQPGTVRVGTAYAVSLLEDRLALLDDELSVAALEAAPAGLEADLWRQRVVVMDSLVQVRYATAATVR